LNDFTKANIVFDNEAYHQKYDSPKKIDPNHQKEPFARGKKIDNLYFATMTQYSKPLSEEGAIAAFPPEVVSMPLSAVISTAGMRQLKITESEKERFVTFYFNGLREKPFPLEERIIIPSPMVPIYDQKPEMSAEELTSTLLKKLSSSEYQFIVVNFPNADMVGHTGNIGATVKAVELLDACIGKLANFVLAYDGLLLITADHGNAEEMINLQTGEIDTEHSTNKVPFIAVSHNFLGNPQTLRTGILADIAPTVISAFNLMVPGSMTGRDLLEELKK
jgi:2,3-bisphosphoglycerate-independent phosphoglycerate mutase